MALLLAIGWGTYAWNVHRSPALGADILSSQSSSTVSSAETEQAAPHPANYDAVVVSPDVTIEGEVRPATPPQGTDADVRLGLLEQEVLRRKAEILRGQLRVLEAERKSLGGQTDPALEEQFRKSAMILTSLIQDQRKADQFLLAAFSQIWEAQNRAKAIGAGEEDTGVMVALEWPVEAALGLSATFRDPSYEERFGFPHDAIDIPVAQGREVHAAAGGIVTDVMDHGLGFSYITIRHAGGVSTLYGHINKFLVQSGQRVNAGDLIGLSGGRPGTLGAGLSTGPHLHFGVFKNGVAVDPESALPRYRPAAVEE